MSKENRGSGSLLFAVIENGKWRIDQMVSFSIFAFYGCFSLEKVRRVGAPYGITFIIR